MFNPATKIISKICMVQVWEHLGRFHDVGSPNTCTYQCLISYRHGWSWACSSVHLEVEPCGHCGGDGKSMPHGKVHNASWIITLCQGDFGKPGSLIDCSTRTDLVNLYEEPCLVLWLLHQRGWHIFISYPISIRYTEGTDFMMAYWSNPSLLPHHPGPPN